MSIPIPPINTLVLGEAINLGTTKINAMAKSVVHVTIDFFALLMYEVYAIQNSTVSKMKEKEGTLNKQVRALKNIVNKMNNTIIET